MSKGHHTRELILRQALDLSSEVGLEGLSIGALAKRVEMSKSGLYAHFESKEDLQIHVLETAGQRFVDVVLAPALKEPRGLPRLRSLFERWLRWATEELTGGCPFIAAAAELDDRPGPVRDRLVGHINDVHAIIARALRVAVEEGHLRADADIDQLVFELWSFLQGYHQFARLMRDGTAAERASRAFENLIHRVASE